MSRHVVAVKREKVVGCVCGMYSSCSIYVDPTLFLLLSSSFRLSLSSSSSSSSSSTLFSPRSNLCITTRSSFCVSSDSSAEVFCFVSYREKMRKIPRKIREKVLTATYTALPIIITVPTTDMGEGDVWKYIFSSIDAHTIYPARQYQFTVTLQKTWNAPEYR